LSIEYRGRFDGKDQKGTVTTGKDGMATIEYPASAHADYFEFTARKPRIVPIRYSWNDNLRPVDLPAVLELRFEPGTTIGGIVNDADGHPIAGAEVDVYGPEAQHDPNGSISFEELKTDARGRWRLDVAPRELAGVRVTISHPRYEMNGAPASRNLESVIVLAKGPSVTGRVIDAAGRPVEGARASFGYDRFAPTLPTVTTNERGEFTLENCARGPSIVTVQAAGFAPQIGDVRVEVHTRPVEIRLTEPGSVLRGKVVDIAGKPVAGAFFAADTWRGHRSLHFRANSDGARAVHQAEWPDLDARIRRQPAGRSECGQCLQGSIDPGDFSDRSRRPHPGQELARSRAQGGGAQGSGRPKALPHQGPDNAEALKRPGPTSSLKCLRIRRPARLARRPFAESVHVKSSPR